MGEDLLEAQAVEEETVDGTVGETGTARPLPEKRRSNEVDVLRDEVRTAAIAAAGGVVAGAATVAAVRAVRGTAKPKRSGLLRRKQERKLGEVVASRSFLIDVHVLGR
jgi:hypothetical protein